MSVIAFSKRDGSRESREFTCTDCARMCFRRSMMVLTFRCGADQVTIRLGLAQPSGFYELCVQHYGPGFRTREPNINSCRHQSHNARIYSSLPIQIAGHRVMAESEFNTSLTVRRNCAQCTKIFIIRSR
jgi:hypothetical protein